LSNQPRLERGSSALHRPLAGRVVIVTRPRRQSAELCQRLEAYGAEAVAMPTIAIAPAPDPEQVRRAMLQLSTYDRVILTSANAVRALREALEQAHVPMSALGGLKVCSIGPGTSRALSEIGIEPDLSASEYRAEGAARAAPRRGGDGRAGVAVSGAAGA
jgi:uroporphyrinogen-III synthase